jgi:hypothetical protein
VGAAAAAAFACSSNQASGANDAGALPPPPFSPCVNGGLNLRGNGQCGSCVQSFCGTQGNAFQSGCADYLSCVCPNGQAIDASAESVCARELSKQSCAGPIDLLNACERDACAGACGVVSGSDFDGGGPVDAGADTTFSCSNGTATFECDQQQVSPSALPAAEQGCIQVGGTPGTGCPTAGLAGCCRLTTTENCYYNDASAQQQTTCQSLGGSWSTTP